MYPYFEWRMCDAAVCYAGSADDPVKLRIHPSSVLFLCRPSWLVFNTVEQDSSGVFSMRDVSSVKPEWLAELASHLYHFPSAQGAGEPGAH